MTKIKTIKVGDEAYICVGSLKKRVQRVEVIAVEKKTVTSKQFTENAFRYEVGYENYAVWVREDEVFICYESAKRKAVVLTRSAVLRAIQRSTNDVASKRLHEMLLGDVEMRQG